MISAEAPHLRGLLDVASALRGDLDLPRLLETVARSISTSLGFGAVVMSLYRPAWDDFETVVVHGNPSARASLLHTTSTAREWEPLMAERFKLGEAFFVPEGTVDWNQISHHWTPQIVASDAPDAWRPEDLLFLPLRSGTGEMLGIVAVDEPVGGRRPGPALIEVLAAVVAQAALAIESAQHAAAASRSRSAAEHLLRVSSHLTADRPIDELLGAVCGGIRDALDFTRVTVYLRDGERSRFVARAGVGWEAGLPRPIEHAEIAGLLRPEHEQEGCILLDSARAHELTPASLHSLYRSKLNGRGPHAWDHDWLMVALYERDGSVCGAIWVDDPADRLRPSRARLQLLRTFANQVQSALENSRRQQRLRYFAEHDHLTGLLNRRGLHDRLRDAAATGSESLVVFDVDGFKRINDALGPETGDRALCAIAAVLCDEAPAHAPVARIGGEEFAVVLDRADEAAALAFAERVRLEAARAVPDVPWTVSLSAGVAVRTPQTPDGGALARAAARALFAAKRLGRDRCVVYHPEALEELMGTLEAADDGRGEQLAAMILLAETLDLRDPGTARHSQTVGRYAERIAHELGWSAERVERVRVAGVLHDIGKLGVSDAILHKPGALAPEEWEEIKLHPELGARIIDHANMRDVAGWVLAHHERLDGRGYPQGLSGEDIPFEARILSVADAYEAMTADRPYRRALPHETAQAELRKHTGTQFDPTVVEAFLRVLAKAPEASGAARRGGRRP
jgi:diguanylate cyclase (GGDEF)-like protein/putative nucleotidyltransferase with HDIG domain